MKTAAQNGLRPADLILSVLILTAATSWAAPSVTLALDLRDISQRVFIVYLVSALTWVPLLWVVHLWSTSWGDKKAGAVVGVLLIIAFCLSLFALGKFVLEFVF